MKKFSPVFCSYAILGLLIPGVIISFNDIFRHNNFFKTSCLLQQYKRLMPDEIPRAKLQVVHARLQACRQLKRFNTVATAV